MLPFRIRKDILLGLHPALCGFDATVIAGPGLTGLVDEFDVELRVLAHVYFREPNAAVPQASIFVTFSMTASRTWPMCLLRNVSHSCCRVKRALSGLSGCIDMKIPVYAYDEQ